MKITPQIKSIILIILNVFNDSSKRRYPRNNVDNNLNSQWDKLCLIASLKVHKDKILCLGRKRIIQ